MSLSLKPITYSPQLNGSGEFVDDSVRVPNEGIKCPCNRKDDSFYKNSKSFRTHILSQRHIKWIASLNENKQSILQEKTNWKKLYKFKNKRLHVSTTICKR